MKYLQRQSLDSLRSGLGKVNGMVHLAAIRCTSVELWPVNASWDFPSVKSCLSLQWQKGGDRSGFKLKEKCGVMVKEFYCPSQDKDSWEVAAAEGFESLFRNLFTHNEEETGCRFLANYIWSHLVTFGHGARMEEYLAKERDIYCLLIWKHSPVVCTSITD